MEFKKSLVMPDSSLYQALEILEETASKLVVVVNESNQILGTLTDGDLRKQVLSNKSLEVPVSQVMNRKFFFITNLDSIQKGFAIMKKNGLTHIPVLDENKVVTNILSISQFLNETVVDNFVVIMAGGKGMRLRPFTTNCPKPMLKINGSPILEIIIKKFIKQGFTKFLISVNYLKNQIIDYFKNGEDFGIEIEYLIEDKPLGTAGALKLISAKSKEPLIIMNGDLLTEMNFRELIDFHKKQSAQATMAVSEYEYNIPYGVVEIQNNKLINFKEKPTYKYLINAGIYVIDPKILNYLKSDEYSEMPDLLEKTKLNNDKVSVYKLQEYWLDIGNKESYHEAYKYLS